MIGNIGLKRIQPGWPGITEHIHVMVAMSQLFGQLCCHNTASSKGGITYNSYIHTVGLSIVYLFNAAIVIVISTQHSFYDRLTKNELSSFPGRQYIRCKASYLLYYRLSGNVLNCDYASMLVIYFQQAFFLWQDIPNGLI